jgi:ketosteroid isomerase-like protein
MRYWLVKRALCLLALVGGMMMNAQAQTSASSADLVQHVMATERAFAKTMAQRDHAAFSSFLSEEAVFFSDPVPLRGKQAVAQAWKRLYEKPEAPFSWEPEQVQVLDSGTLALSTGPVRNAKGELIATFTSIWRQEQPGVWRIVFDKGNDVCPCAKP